MLPKPHLTLHSRMSGSGWVITPLCYDQMLLVKKLTSAFYDGQHVLWNVMQIYVHACVLGDGRKEKRFSWHHTDPNQESTSPLRQSGLSALGRSAPGACTYFTSVWLSRIINAVRLLTAWCKVRSPPCPSWLWWLWVLLSEKVACQTLHHTGCAPCRCRNWLACRVTDQGALKWHTKRSGVSATRAWFLWLSFKTSGGRECASQVVLLGKSLSPNVRRIRDVGSIPGLGISPGEGHGNPLQYSCQENPMDRAAWRATVYRVVKSWTQPKWLSMQHACMGRETHRNTKLTSDFPNQKAFVTQAAIFFPLKVY